MPEDERAHAKVKEPLTLIAGSPAFCCKRWEYARETSVRYPYCNGPQDRQPCPLALFDGESHSHSAFPRLRGCGVGVVQSLRVVEVLIGHSSEGTALLKFYVLVHSEKLLIPWSSSGKSHWLSGV